MAEGRIHRGTTVCGRETVLQYFGRQGGGREPKRQVRRNGTKDTRKDRKIFYGWSPKFGRNLPRLLNVTAFEGILIHPGNTADDSAGCILVGLNTEKGKLTQSRFYSNMLNCHIEEAQRKGETITIEIV